MFGSFLFCFGEKVVVFISIFVFVVFVGFFGFLIW